MIFSDSMTPRTSGLPPIHVLRNISVHEFTRNIAEKKRARMLTEPCSVTNISSFIDQVGNWRKFFGNIQPFFALKAQNNPVTRRLFHRLGYGYDCASLFEIKNVLSTGCSPDKIVVSHPYKSYHCIAGKSLEQSRL